MSILLYDFDFNFLCSEQRIISYRKRIFFNGIGTFEVHLPLCSPIGGYVAQNPYTVIGDGKSFAVVIGFEMGDELTVYARTCNWLFQKRTVAPFSAEEENTSLLCRNLVSEAFSDVPEFILGNSIDDNSVISVSKQNRTYLWNSMSEILSSSCLGHEVIFDVLNRRWVFNILKSRESDLIISEANKNAFDTALSSDILELSSCGYYQNDNNEWVMINCGEDTGIYRWESLSSQKTEDEAVSDFNKHVKRDEVILSAKGQSFGHDYFLGDVLRVQITKGAYRTTLKKIISGVEISSLEGTYTEKPIFEDFGG